MANKTKIFLLFVEGSTDEECLDVIMDYFKTKINLTDIKIHVQHGDIFSSYDNLRKNGRTILKEQVEKYLRYSKLKTQDIFQVAFVTDTDGIYMEQSVYEIDPSVENFQYNLESGAIICKDQAKKESLIEIRQIKRQKLDPVIGRLGSNCLTIERIKIPYSIYYNSLNLEHVLFDQILSQNQKVVALDKLLDDIDEDPVQLMQMFLDKGLEDSYEESWEAIRSKEMEQGYTNLPILFDMIRNIGLDNGGLT